MAKQSYRKGSLESSTLLRGAPCLWLGFHKNIDDYLNTPIIHPKFQKLALSGCIGTINQAGLHGAEVEFPTKTKKGFATLTLSVQELLPMTIEQVDELKESISSIQGEATVAQTKENSQVVSTETKLCLYECTENGCAFTSISPQGLGTHRVKSHNLESRSQKRSGGREIVIPETKITNPGLNNQNNTVTKSVVSTDSLNSTENWKSRHDAMVKRYNRLSTKHEAVMRALTKLSNGH